MLYWIAHSVSFPPLLVISPTREEEWSALRYCLNIINLKMSKGKLEIPCQFWQTWAVLCRKNNSDNLMLLTGERGYTKNTLCERVYAHALRKEALTSPRGIQDPQSKCHSSLIGWKGCSQVVQEPEWWPEPLILISDVLGLFQILRANKGTIKHYKLLYNSG